MVTFELREKPGEPYAESPEYTATADGSLNFTYDTQNCYSAHVVVVSDPANQPAVSTTAIILPADNPNSFSPYLVTGATYKFRASVGRGGYFRVTVL